MQLKYILWHNPSQKKKNHEERGDLPTLVTPEANDMEEESGFAEPKSGRPLCPHTQGTKMWQLCEWPDV